MNADRMVSSLEINNQAERAPDFQPEILASFHELLKNPDILVKVKDQIFQMSDQIQKMQLLQIINRVLRIEDAIDTIKAVTVQRLHQLLNAVLIKGVNPQAQ